MKELEPLTVPFPDEFFEPANLKLASLEQLGAAVAVCTFDRRHRVGAELASRVGYPWEDGALRKAEGLFDYHAAAFKREPSPQHCREMLAVMLLIEFLNQ